MREPPPGVTEADVAAVLRTHWGIEAEVTHLPVGFGAHHWRAAVDGRPTSFVTLDTFGAHHDAASLEAAYASAAALRHLDFVLAPVPAVDGRCTVPFAGGALSCTPWVAGEVAGDGSIGDRDLARTNLAVLARLHAAVPPAGIPRWTPRVGADFAGRLAATTEQPWTTGPYGEPARAAVAQRAAAIATWTDRYHALVAAAADRTWVPTHGEPHSRNQLRTAAGVVFVDWESLALAPRERDLGPLIDVGWAAQLDPDWAMVELFDLEWRLDEIGQYAAWFAAPHAGTESDRVAYHGLLGELARREWTRPA